MKSGTEILAPWSLIRSSISKYDVSSIRRRFYIPDEYQIIVPGPKDRIDKPPYRCLAFHVTSLEAGLRFPLSRHIEEILSGLNICPAQLMPNAYRHIVIFMILMRYFQVNPSFVHFGSYISTVSVTKTGTKGFFTFNPNYKYKLCYPPSLSGCWKSKFVYIKPPKNRPWSVPILWNVKLSKPDVIESPSWGHDFMLSSYDSSKILNEEVLVLAGLSPAPIKTTKSLDMAVRASMVAKSEWEQSEDFSASSQPVVQEPSMGKRAKVEDLSGDEVRTVDWVGNAEKIARDMPGDEALLARSQPVVQEPSTGKRARVEDLSGMAVRASMVAKAMAEQREALLARCKPVVQEPSTGKRARVEDLSGDEVRTADWVCNAEKIARDMRGSSSQDGEIGLASSVFKPSVDEDTLEKYRYTLRETDQLALVDLPLTNLEDVAAYHSLAINSIIHHLHLRAACLKKESLSLNDTNHENVLLRKRVDELQRENVESFNAGRAVGREEFVESDEYRSAVKREREESVRAFLKSNTYATLVAKSAAVYEFDGFEKCRTQAMKLGAFRREFDPRRLDPFKTGIWRILFSRMKRAPMRKVSLQNFCSLATQNPPQLIIGSIKLLWVLLHVI